MKSNKQFFNATLLTAIALCLLMFTSCKKETVQDPTQQNLPATHFLKGFLGNEEIAIQNNSSYFTDISNQNSGEEDHNGHQDLDDLRSLLITGCRWHATDEQGTTVTGSVELRKEVFRIYVTPFMNNQYYGMLAPNYNNFAYQNGSLTGAYVTMRDKNGVLWTSKGDQAGSTFQITTRGTNKQTFSTVTGAVTCKMYDGNGNMKLFTGGTFVANCGL